jgi:hypothetical protein
MAPTDVRQDAADYNRLAHEWKKSFATAGGKFHDGRVDATSR